jgi:hypothetical protein
MVSDALGFNPCEPTLQDTAVEVLVYGPAGNVGSQRAVLIPEVFEVAFIDKTNSFGYNQS